MRMMRRAEEVRGDVVGVGQPGRRGVAAIPAVIAVRRRRVRHPIRRRRRAERRRQTDDKQQHDGYSYITMTTHTADSAMHDLLMDINRTEERERERVTALR
jgi:hypothetical protein